MNIFTGGVEVLVSSESRVSSQSVEAAISSSSVLDPD